MIVYRPSDRIPVKISELTFWLAPLTFQQKVHMEDLAMQVQGKKIVDLAQLSFLSVKYCLKILDGDIKYSDGSQFKLEFDKDGILTDDSTNDVLNLGRISLTLIKSCTAMLQDIATAKIEGAEIDIKSMVNIKKKQTIKVSSRKSSNTK